MGGTQSSTLVGAAEGQAPTWDVLGRSKGDHEPLKPLTGYNQFWFAWSSFNHGSSVFNRTSPVNTGAIAGAGDCAVPCDEIRLGCPGKDCIPALTAPQVVSADDPNANYLDDGSFVVGVHHNGEARAYPHNILWWHEIVNDVVGGVPVAVTHCPLTFSSINHDPSQFISGQNVELGVSGRLYNSNLVFYNRSDDTWFSQLLGVGTKGAGLGTAAPRVPAFEMTWAAWRTLNPDTTVLTTNTGHARDYQRYPYGSYFTDDNNTFSAVRPAPDPAFPNKAITYGIHLNGESRAYVHEELAAWARAQNGDDAPPRGVINEELGSVPIAVVFDIDASYVQAFDRTGWGTVELVD